MTSADQCNSRSRRATPTPGDAIAMRGQALGTGSSLFCENHGLYAAPPARASRQARERRVPATARSGTGGLSPCKAAGCDCCIGSAEVIIRTPLKGFRPLLLCLVPARAARFLLAPEPVTRPAARSMSRLRRAGHRGLVVANMLGCVSRKRSSSGNSASARSPPLRMP